MLFNSYAFILLFLPLTFAGFFFVGRYSRAAAAVWLFAASLFFYAWWNPAYVALLLASIVFNYLLGTALSKRRLGAQANYKKLILGAGVAIDLCLLGYYKYSNFFIENVDTLLGAGWQMEPVILPLGISFFTFTQVAFLVDAYRGDVKESSFIHYGLFGTYFPHLIAGPVLHHKEMMPQFALPATYRVQWENISVGLTIFGIGLFKKVVLADGVAPFANVVFNSAAEGAAPTFLSAWGGALSYTFQLYFDFSGYSDMAIGVSRLFGVTLPLNFSSPYKSVNVIEFWRRWHMTLSRFLRDYLYFALGGNRKGRARRYVNLALTMILGGLWHGAGWTFIAWGALHGAFLVVNHLWQQMWRVKGDSNHSSAASRGFATALTFFVVVIGWVFFRAENIDTALTVLRSMAGVEGFSMHGHHKELRGMWKWLTLLALIIWFAPNTQQIMAPYKPVLENVEPSARIRWRPAYKWLLATICVLFYAITKIGRVSEFLYFQF